MSSRRNRFWDFVCLFSRQAYVFLALSIALLFFMAFAWVNEPSEETRPLITLNVTILSINVVVLFALIRRCQSRRV